MLANINRSSVLTSLAALSKRALTVSISSRSYQSKRYILSIIRHLFTCYSAGRNKSTGRTRWAYCRTLLNKLYIQHARRSGLHRSILLKKYYHRTKSFEIGQETYGLKLNCSSLTIYLSKAR